MKDFFHAAPAPTLQKASSSATSRKVEELFDEDNLSDTIVDVSSDEEKDLRIDCDLSSPGKSRILVFSLFSEHSNIPCRMTAKAITNIINIAQ